MFVLRYYHEPVKMPPMMRHKKMMTATSAAVSCCRGLSVIRVNDVIPNDVTRNDVAAVRSRTRADVAFVSVMFHANVVVIVTYGDITVARC